MMEINLLVPEWFLWVLITFMGIAAGLTAANIYLKIRLQAWRKRTL